jgi:hypothetical protein
MKNRKLVGKLLLVMLLAVLSLGLGKVNAASTQRVSNSKAAASCRVGCDLCITILGIAICLDLP